MSVNGNIRKFSYDLTLNDGKIFDILGDQLISLAKNKLIKIVEAVVEQTGEKDLIIDNLEIDVGQIDINNLDALALAFENELKRILSLADKLHTRKDSKKDEEALLFFIEKGYYPWWISSKERFNTFILGLDTTLSFSNQFLSTAFINQQKYFRLSGSLEPAAKKKVIKKLVGQNQRFFNSLVRFFEEIRTRWIIIPQANTLQLRAFEYFLIYQMGVIKQVNQQVLFFSAVEYISKRLNMPLTYFLSLLSTKLDSEKLDSNIHSLLIALLEQLELKAFEKGKEIEMWQRAVEKNRLFSVLEERNRLLPSKFVTNDYLNNVIQYFEKGIFENIFDLIDHYKSKFEFLVHSKNEKFIQHLSANSFLQSKIKVARLASISNNLSLEQITEWLDTDKETRGIIEDLRKIFATDEFKATLSFNEAASFSPSFFHKAILVTLLKTRKQEKASSVFIDTFLKQYVNTGAIDRNELLFELYKLGEKKNLKQISNRLIDLLLSSSTRIGGSFGKAEETKGDEVDEMLPEPKFPRIEEVPKMSTQDQLSFILELFSQLQDPTTNFEKFLFPHSILAYLDASTLDRFFNQIKSQLDYDVLQSIEELLQELALRVTKKELLLVYQSSFTLLMTKQRPLNAAQFKNELIKHFIKKELLFFKKEKKEPVKMASSNLKEDLASQAQIDKAYLSSMKKEDLTQFILDLFQELPASKKILEQILFKRSLSSIMDVALMKSIFQQLREKLQFDLIEKVDAIVHKASKEKKDFLRLEGFRYSLLILLSKGTQITPDQFSESLLGIMIRHYPKSFESSMKSILKESKKESTLEKMMREIHKRLDGKVQKFHENSSKEKFNTLLQLKQDILINAEQYDTNTLEELFESYADILVSKENFLLFLKTHFQDHELMLAFTEISLQPEQTEILKGLVDQEVLIFELEKHLQDLQRQFNVVVLPFESFKVILRVFILKKIGAKGNMHEFSESEFVIDFFESLKRENFINLQQLSIFLETTPKNEIDKTLVESLTIFNLSSKFSISKTKLKDTLYFKDLVFSFLQTDSIPSWANVENFDLNDVVSFLKTTINKEDRQFLLSLLNDPKINKRLVAVIQALQEQEKMRFLELIQQSGANFNLATLVQHLLDYLSDISLSDQASNTDFFIGLILNQGLWKQSSLMSFIEKVAPFIFQKTSFKKTALIAHLEEKGFNISKALYQITKKGTLKNEELVEVLKFFLETNNFPKNLLHRRDELQSKIHTLFLSQEDRLWSILNEYSNKPNLFDRLFTFIDFRTLFNFIEKNRFGDFTFFTPVSAAIYELDDQKKFSKKEQSQLLVTLLIKFEKQVTEVKLKEFWTTMRQENSTRFEELLFETQKSVEKQTPIDQDHKRFFEALNITHKEFQAHSKQFIDPLNLLDYYLEIGSVNYENKPLSKKALFQALEQLIKEDLVVTKRVLYQWIRSDLRLSRLLDLIPPRRTSFLLDLLHPDLVKFLDLFSISVLKFFDTPIEKVLSIKNNKDFQHKILKYWSSRNIFLDSPLEIIVLLFEEILKIENVSSKTYFDKQLNAEEELPLQMSHFLSLLKRSYTNYKNQLTEELILKEEGGGFEEQLETDALVIQNAGLIILWPFFYRLFDKCGFLIEKEFKDNESLQKAILLTQYLVTGVAKCNENELILNKILCGAPQNSHVDVTIELDVLYIDLCDSLLKGVLKNWEKLSNSSVETLRETFLIREGILRSVELDYNLDVIKGPFDMLIETIPWNISIIQTTFMKNRITVDWK